MGILYQKSQRLERSGFMMHFMPISGCALLKHLDVVEMEPVAKPEAPSKPMRLPAGIGQRLSRQKH
jgi:hypothetical protein